jgi:DNA-binding transcriptional MerR regulator
MQGLTIQEAAATTGWSARMLRYIEAQGLVAAQRSPGRYRLYGPAELQRLRTLRELLAEHDLVLSDVGFAARLMRDDRLRESIRAWLDAAPSRPADVRPTDWLRWEQDKHQRLLAGTVSTASTSESATSVKESA